MKILGIETSCDETAAAVIEDGRYIHSNVVASQATLHARYGGIVPEIASRQHMVTIVPVLRQALEEASLEAHELDGVAVTHGPGLAGALLIGVNAAKGFALSNELPFIGLNHLEGHIYAAWLEEGVNPERSPGFPLMCLIASGGHTDLILMKGHGDYTLIARTRDDAAGEAFDKAARALGLGFPGGPEIQRVAEHSIGGERRFPRPVVRNSLDFSFSGLKTAVARRAEEYGMYPPSEVEPDPQQVANVADAFQEAIVDCMVQRTIQAAKSFRVKGVILGGGVAANSHLRQEMHKRVPVEVIVPRPGLCTDNGAMMGAAGFFHFRDGIQSQWDVDVVPSLRLG